MGVHPLARSFKEAGTTIIVGVGIRERFYQTIGHPPLSKRGKRKFGGGKWGRAALADVHGPSGGWGEGRREEIQDSPPGNALLVWGEGKIKSLNDFYISQSDRQRQSS